MLLRFLAVHRSHDLLHDALHNCLFLTSRTSPQQTGIHGYRRRVPEGIRDTIGQGEIVKSFESSDPKVVKLRHAEFHAGVERLFAQAKTCAGISSDLVFEAAGGFQGPTRGRS